MVWVRIDDHFDEHPKIVGLDDHAFALFVAGLAYCNRNLTDGFIPTAVGLGKLRYCNGGAKRAAQALESAGMWLPVDGGWMVHDFDDYQPTKQQVEDERAKKQAAGQAGGQASARARATAGAPANGQAHAQAKSNPVPGPVPGPVPIKNLTVLPPSTTSTAPPNFNASESAVIELVTETLAPWKFALNEAAWRTVFEEFGVLHLGLEAHKQADWLRRKGIKMCSASRYTNWLAKAQRDYETTHPEDVEDEVVPAAIHQCTGRCAHSCSCDQCATNRQRRKSQVSA